MKDYNGFSIEDLKTRLEYDPDKGTFTSKATKKVIVDKEYKVRHPVTKKTSTLQLARVAVMFMTNDFVEDSKKIKFKDGDPWNLKYDNLVVMTPKEFMTSLYSNNYGKNQYLETEHPHVYVGTMNRLFVVRRSSDQAVYRTYSKEEAFAVADRWLESGKKLHENDGFIPKWYKKYIENDKNEHIS